MNAGGHGTVQERRVDRAWHLTEALGSVKAIYRSAWSMTPGEEKVIHVFLDAAVSVIAPVAIVWAAIDTRISYYDRFPVSLNVMLLVVPPIAFVLACYVLKKYGKDTPILAFAALLFSSGAVFTFNELVDHTRERTIPCVNKCETWPDCISNPPDNCERDDDPSSSESGRESRNPPWGDFLLAFSAFCVMIEEFSLFGIYRVLARQVYEVSNLKESATDSHDKLIKLTKDTAEKYWELTRLNEQANTLYRNMARQADEWNESRRVVLLKACGLVAIIMLAFTAMCN